MTTEAIARTYNSAGRLFPRGTLRIEAIEGNSFQPVLCDRGETIELPVITAPPGPRRHYALLAKAFAVLAEGVDRP